MVTNAMAEEAARKIMRQIGYPLGLDLDEGTKRYRDGQCRAIANTIEKEHASQRVQLEMAKLALNEIAGGVYSYTKLGLIDIAQQAVVNIEDTFAYRGISEKPKPVSEARILDL